MKPDLKRIFLVAYVVLIGGPLLYAFMFIGVGGRWGCLGARYERFDFFADGARLRLFSGGAPAYSIFDEALDPRSVRAYDGFYNVTDFLECAREEKYAARISYIELRSAALTRVVARWRARHVPVSGFRGGEIWKDPVILDSNGYPPGFRVWDPALVKATAPEWVPLAQLQEVNVIAFWGDGHLFQGTQPDQYYWVGYH